MGSLTYIHPIFRRATPEQEELMADRDEMEDQIAHLKLLVARRLSTLSIVGHVGGVDPKDIAERVEELCRDVLYPASSWLESRLEDISQ
jgi:hypothetical protein